MKKKSKIIQKSLLEILIEETEKGGGYITDLLTIKKSDDLWRGMIAVPPGTLVDTIVSEFDRKTNIPLELPFFSVFHFLAAYLLYNGIKLKVSGYDKNCGDSFYIRPDIWTVILASSGSGKTFTTSTLKRGIPYLDNISYDIAGIVSTARFIDDLQEHNHKLLLRDEFNEFYKQILGMSGPLSEMRDVFLRMYDNAKIVRKKKNEEIVIDDSAIVFLGTTVTDSFTNSVTADDMINGFCQRFSFILAKKDTKKKMIDYPIYSISTSSWEKEWNNMIKTIKHDTYIADKNAMNYFIKAFRSFAHDEMDESFYRRQMWKAHKFALIYHILTGHGTEKTVSVESYSWAARMTHLLLQDCTLLLKDHGFSEIEKKIQKVEALRDRLALKGIEITTRLVCRHIRSIKTVSEASAILHAIHKKTTIID